MTKDILRGPTMAPGDLLALIQVIQHLHDNSEQPFNPITQVDHIAFLEWLIVWAPVISAELCDNEDIRRGLSSLIASCASSTASSDRQYSGLLGLLSRIAYRDES